MPDFAFVVFVCESNFDLGSDQVGGERMRTKFPGIVVTTSVLQPAFEYRKCLTIILLSLQMSHYDKKKKYPIFCVFSSVKTHCVLLLQNLA